MLDQLVGLWATPVRQWGLRRKFAVRTVGDEILIVSRILGRSSVCSTTIGKFFGTENRVLEHEVQAICQKGHIPVIYVAESQCVVTETLGGIPGEPPRGLELLKPQKGFIDFAYDDIISDPDHF